MFHLRRVRYPLWQLEVEGTGTMQGSDLNNMFDYHLEGRRDSTWTSRRLILDPRGERGPAAIKWVMYEEVSCIRILQDTCNGYAKDLQLRMGVRLSNGGVVCALAPQIRGGEKRVGDSFLKSSSLSV